MLQDDIKRHEDVTFAAKRAQDRNFTPTWPNLGSSWPHIDPKNLYFVWEGLHFSAFQRFALEDAKDASKMAPRGRKRLQDGPKRPQDGPKRLQDTPRWPQEEPKTIP